MSLSPCFDLRLLYISTNDVTSVYTKLEQYDTSEAYILSHDRHLILGTKLLFFIIYFFSGLALILLFFLLLILYLSLLSRTAIYTNTLEVYTCHRVTVRPTYKLWTRIKHNIIGVTARLWNTNNFFITHTDYMLSFTWNLYKRALFVIISEIIPTH